MARRSPKVPMDRRMGAFAIDVVVASLLSLAVGSGSLIPLFIVSWIGLRVVLASKNKGQSLGRWALDIKVVSFKYGSIPGLVELAKREAVTGLGCLLVLIGLANLSPTNGFILVAVVPILVDCGFAWADEGYQQALHDRLAQTIVVQTHRGYSLDIKLRKMFAQARHRVK